MSSWWVEVSVRCGGLQCFDVLFQLVLASAAVAMFAGLHCDSS